jgi:hypothetical protein
MSERDLGRVRHLLTEATARISRDYFMLPVTDAEGGEPLIQYRERVYAYELYHQLRSIWPDWPYSLAGEVDKRGHPLIRGGDLDNAKPDLLVHVPGKMEHNLLVLEIKAVRSRENPVLPAALTTDLRKLIAFRRAGYAGAVFLAFGDSVDRVRQLARRCQEVRESLFDIELWHHEQPGSPAIPIQW